MRIDEVDLGMNTALATATSSARVPALDFPLCQRMPPTRSSRDGAAEALCAGKGVGKGVALRYRDQIDQDMIVPLARINWAVH
ncbi:hypothetical protein [Sphingomonas koreensis]